MGEFIGIMVLLLVAFLGYMAWDAAQYRQELEAAREAYFAALADLKADPINSELRERALWLGRKYSAVTRKKQGSGVTVYDEVAISNDIGAACAAAAGRSPKVPKGRAAVVEGDASVEARLQKVESLRERGLITEEEYLARRERILDEL